MSLRPRTILDPVANNSLCLRQELNPDFVVLQAPSLVAILTELPWCYKCTLTWLNINNCRSSGGRKRFSVGKLQPVDDAGRIPQVRDARSLKYHECHEAKDIDSLQCRPRGHRGQPALLWWITLLCRCYDHVWGPDIYSRFCLSRHVCSKTGSRVPSFCYARTSPFARLRNWDHCSNSGNVTNSGNGSQLFRRRCPWSCNMKIKDQPSFCGRRVAQQTAVCRNPHHLPHWYSRFTWQMGY